MAGVYVDGVSVNVADQLEYFKTHADSASASAISYASGLATQYTFTADDVTAPLASTSNLELESLVKPNAPTVSFVGIKEPPSVSLNPIAFSRSAKPAYDVESLPLTIPTAPQPLNISQPVRDFAINLNLEVPVASDREIPLVPTLESYSLPKIAPVISDIAFTATFPTIASIAPPANVFNFSNSPYNSSFSSKIKEELVARLTKSTGLSPVVEEALWARASDRELKASLLAQDTLLIDRAGSGFSRPTGAMFSALDNIVMESQSKIIELSREIALKQADLEQANIKETIVQSIALEDLLLRTYIDNATRSLEVAKYTQELAIELFKSEVSVKTLEVEAYKAFTSAYEAKVKAQLTKLDKFRAELEAEKLKGEVNVQKISLYQASLEGLKANIDLYKADIDAVNSKLQIEATKLSVYSEDIKNYTALVSAKASEFSMYSTRVEAEKVKADITQSQIQGYAARIQAYSNEVDAKSKEASVSLQINDQVLKKYETDLDAYIKKLQAKQLTYQSAIEIYKGESELYRADIEYQKAKSEIAQKTVELDIQNVRSTADVALSNARLKLEALSAGVNSTIEGRKAAGSIHQALAQASLSAVNVSMGANAAVYNNLNESHDFTN